MSQDDLRQDAQRFGEYEVMRDACGGAMLLGSGSYGRTYKARHLLLGTEVAIKVIRRELTASESTRQRFLREGRALAGLTHDHIAMMRYFGRNDDGQLYYAMDYCGGGTLAERVRRLGPRPPGEALDVVRQAALALAAAHAAGIIHRDLKPGNIMLTHTPPPLRVKVIDFGLALSSGSGAAAGRFHGTAQWASPEQLREATLDGRSDLFSLGLVLWFLLEGTIPDQGTTAEVVHGRLSPGGYASRLPQGLPPGIPELLGQLLEIDPSRRPASAVELLGAINALCDAYPYEPVAEQQAVAEDDSGAAELPCLSGAAASDDRYARLTRLHRDLAGEWFMAELEGEGARIVFVLDEQRAENPSLRAKVRANLARLRRQSVDGLPRFAVFYETNSTLVAEWEGNSGDDLISWLRLRNKVRLSDSISFLTRVAEAADDAASCGVPGLGLMASQVRWEYCGSSESGGGLRGAVPRLFPLLLDASDVPAGDCLLADVSGSTLTLASPDLACDRVFMLAKLIYRMVSGREVPDAVAHSPGAYVAVSALSEQGNALMAESLGRGRTWDSCLALLRAIAHAENLSIGGSGTGRTQTSSSGSGSNVRSSALRGQPFSTPPPSKHLSPTSKISRSKVKPLPWIIAACVVGAWAMVAAYRKPEVNTVRIVDEAVVQRERDKAEAATAQAKEAEQRAAKAEQEKQTLATQAMAQEEAAKQEKQALAEQAKAQEETAKQAVEQQRAADLAKEEASNIIKTAKDQPFVNSLGMKFVPVPGTKALFSIWDTRVKDFEAFVKSTGFDATGGMVSLHKGKPAQNGATWKNPGFLQTPDHPVVGVSWEDAKAFCKWLTEKERKSARIEVEQEYRLPTDMEWNAAVGGGKYPWGNLWPPPKAAGNYAGREAKDEDWPDKMSVIEGYRDDYARTSPVGSFIANEYGLFDMGGNVCQWCEDWYRAEIQPKELLDKYTFLKQDDGGKKYRVVRGASWNISDPDSISSSIRDYVTPDSRSDRGGFRCVLVIGADLAKEGRKLEDAPELTRATWDVKIIGGDDYVSVGSIKQFYHFTKLTRNGPTNTLENAKIMVNLNVGSTECIMNKVKFVLSKPVGEIDSNAYVSRTDLAKLIDPVLRPNFIKNAGNFKTVILDAGHGGKDRGITSAYGTEADYTLKVAYLIKEQLIAKGYKVFMTRDGDRTVSEQARVKAANAIKEDAIFISIHFGSGGQDIRGIETFSLSPPGVPDYGKGITDADKYLRAGNEHDSANVALATAVHGLELRALGTNTVDRGIKRARFDVLSGLDHPAILLNGGFITHPYEARLIHNEKYQAALASGIAAAVEKYRAAVSRARVNASE